MCQQAAYTWRHPGIQSVYGVQRSGVEVNESHPSTLARGSRAGSCAGRRRCVIAQPSAPLLRACLPLLPPTHVLSMIGPPARGPGLCGTRSKELSLQPPRLGAQICGEVCDADPRFLPRDPRSSLPLPIPRGRPTVALAAPHASVRPECPSLPTVHHHRLQCRLAPVP